MIDKSVMGLASGSIRVFLELGLGPYCASRQLASITVSTWSHCVAKLDS